jgi:DNA-binding CsgD family transcriptional regulator
VNDYVKELYQILAVNSRYEAIGQLLAMSNTPTAEHQSGACARQRFIGAQLLFSHQGDLLYSDDCLAELTPALSDVIATRLQHSECHYHYYNGLIISLDKRKEFLLTSITDMSVYADRLTAREIQVAFLIGQFFSNAAIAEALGISVKTVENQLTRIYQKLTLRSRSELVAQLNQRVGL